MKNAMRFPMYLVLLPVGEVEHLHDEIARLTIENERLKRELDRKQRSLDAIIFRRDQEDD